MMKMKKIIGALSLIVIILVLVGGVKYFECGVDETSETGKVTVTVSMVVVSAELVELDSVPEKFQRSYSREEGDIITIGSVTATTDSGINYTLEYVAYYFAEDLDESTEDSPITIGYRQEDTEDVYLVLIGPRHEDLVLVNLKAWGSH